MIVTRSLRGQGLLRPVLDAALARDLGPERALLWCSPANAAMLRAASASEIDAPVDVALSPRGRLEMPLP